MSFRVSAIGIIFLFICGGLYAQSPVTSTGLVEYEVLTAELQSNPEPQSIRLRITTISTANVEYIDMRLSGMQGKLTMLYAEKSGQALWLIQSAEKNSRENVLAWNYTDSTGLLRVYPYSYLEPYTLTLELQVNLTAYTDIPVNQQNSLVVEAGLPNGVFAATLTGRGNTITLNQ